MAVISYSGMYTHEDPVFGAIEGRAGVLYVQPGRLRSASEHHGRPTLIHDCSTTAGSGGAPVVDLATGLVLGIHWGGSRADGNFAVPAWELARDARVRQHGLNLSDEPSWMVHWAHAEWLSGRKEVKAAPVPAPTPAVAPAKRKEKVFTVAELHEIHRLLVDADAATTDRQPDLFMGMNPAFVASLPDSGAPATRLRRALDILHRAPRLSDGDLPLEIFLLNAVSITAPRPESEKLAAYLKKLQEATRG